MSWRGVDAGSSPPPPDLKSHAATIPKTWVDNQGFEHQEHMVWGKYYREQKSRAEAAEQKVIAEAKRRSGEVDALSTRLNAAEARVAELERVVEAERKNAEDETERAIFSERRLQQATEALREIAKWEKPAVADRPSINDFIALAKSALAALAGEDEDAAD